MLEGRDGSAARRPATDLSHPRFPGGCDRNRRGDLDLRLLVVGCDDAGIREELGVGIRIQRVERHRHLRHVQDRELATRRDFEFRIVGNFDYAMPGVNLKVIQFDKAREIEDLDHFDVGVYPLPDEPWVYGKSGLKAIQYMAFGLPVISMISALRAIV